LEVERERFRAEQEAVERELPAAYRRLAAVVGDPRLPSRPLAARFDDPPAYDLDQARETVLAVHPDIRAAQVAVERAQFAVRRAEAEPIPNVTVNTGYTRQNQNRSNDWQLQLSMPIPVWNKNQGNVRAARAEVGSAVQDVGRVQNDLAERVATTFRTYASAKQRADRYRTSIIPRATETFELSVKAFKGGQFEYLRVLQAQRTAAEARLEYNRSLGEAWRAAAELSGLLLEEAWPPPGAAAPPPEPAKLPDPRPLQKNDRDDKKPPEDDTDPPDGKQKPDREKDLEPKAEVGDGRWRVGPRIPRYDIVRLDSSGAWMIMLGD
jgi:cobalt-zinc-cadmium efflux system outer membrane protein